LAMSVFSCERHGDQSRRVATGRSVLARHAIVKRNTLSSSASYVERLKFRVTVSTKRSGFPFKSSGE